MRDHTRQDAVQEGRDDVNPAQHVSDDYAPAPVQRVEHRESRFTRLVEQQAARLPSHLFLFASFFAMAVSLVAELAGHPRVSRLVGMWAPTLLIMGVYNKLVKTLGTR